MLDETINPQTSDPPTNTGGGSTTPSDADELETADALLASEPPTNTGGGSSA
jgi:hypothetical protein